MIFSKRRNSKVRLYLQDGPTIEGILAAETPRDFVIWAPRVLEDEEATVAVSGHVEVPRERVLFKQILG